MKGQPAPELNIVQWFNTTTPLDLKSLRGKVVVLHAFQMLCPGCVQHGLPQTQKMSRLFAAQDVVVIGIHTVFEHHAAMSPVSLEAFIHEYGLRFPIGVDRAGEGHAIPQTMAAYKLRGTPSLVLIDRQGIIRHHSIGAEDDMQIGAEIALLLAEKNSGQEAAQ